MKTWRELRSKYVTPENEAAVAAAAAEQMAEVRAYRLAEARKRRDLTQEQVADAMGVTQARVSQIENGALRRSEIETLISYVNAIGGRLEVVADFGEERFVLDAQQPPPVLPRPISDARPKGQTAPPSKAARKRAAKKATA